MSCTRRQSRGLELCTPFR